MELSPKLCGGEGNFLTKPASAAYRISHKIYINLLKIIIKKTKQKEKVIFDAEMIQVWYKTVGYCKHRHIFIQTDIRLMRLMKNAKIAKHRCYNCILRERLLLNIFF